MEVTVSVDFCYGHRLLNYSGKCRHFHGHNGRVEVTAASDSLDDTGFVVDFSDLKSFTKKWIDETWDHRMQLNEKDDALRMIMGLDSQVRPVPYNPTAENMAIELLTVTNGFLDTTFKTAKQERLLDIVSVRFWETPTSFAEVFNTETYKRTYT
tara:strand:+ start:94 stop:555 length:462 start_codon:yes stop_codon:yes gene_type:complete